MTDRQRSIYVLALAAGGPQIGAWLQAMDFEANEGRGQAQLTIFPARAMRFDSAADALEYWKTQSRTVPLRPDGKPNRPLTAFTVEIMAPE